ncbi:hypothetical protein NG99_08935 [Erwinia typographi]|uniref:Uncharacterized protein n=1 Tax=Erwinia typographi TaxID=371042 RepID=A0A0A3Z916_9GAMM|nr:hypothetical protein NG99_08935 [Erwinia typographi]
MLQSLLTLDCKYSCQTDHLYLEIFRHPGYGTSEIAISKAKFIEHLIIAVHTSAEAEAVGIVKL